jgi:hypothetical protein
MTVLIVLLAVAVGFLGLLVAGVLRSHAEILRALHELGVNLDPDAVDAADHDHGAREHSPSRRRLPTMPGVPEPRETDTAAFDVAGTDPFGEAVTAAVIGTEHLTLLAFLSSTCLTCRGFWDALGDPRLEIPGGARPLIVAKGIEAESESALRKLAPRSVTTVLSSEAWSAYEVPVAPYFVLVDGLRREVVGEGAAATWEQVRNLMEQSLADAGLAVERGRRVASGPKAATARRGGAEREERIDAELRAAGVESGDPSLYQPPAPLAEPGHPSAPGSP